ncbi:MAG: carbon-nitrogen family hydrolase [Bacteroidales bacterium]|nr:carbon-nitrogen family hydrolase [Clostridium sp.]MCM1203396.1 carbon-nitrogen family hydrolase [Bacteroidales bacterium]
MKVGLTQMDIVWEDKEKNMARARKLMEQAAGQGVELLVFPEMTLTGFTMNTKLAGEEMLFSPTLRFFKETSRQYHMAMAFGFVEDFGEEYYNKLMIVSEGRILYDYDKIHPFNYSEEGKHYIGGHEVKTAMLKDVSVSGFVCYDLRFPEIFQAVSAQSDMILVIANWPKERVLHWETLLRARAIENQCYLIGVNRIGKGNGLEYAESSMAFDPMGERLTKAHSKAELMIVDIHPEKVAEARRRFPFKEDRQVELYETFYTRKITDVQETDKVRAGLPQESLIS